MKQQPQQLVSRGSIPMDELRLALVMPLVTPAPNEYALGKSIPRSAFVWTEKEIGTERGLTGLVLLPNFEFSVHLWLNVTSKDILRITHNGAEEEEDEVLETEKLSEEEKKKKRIVSKDEFSKRMRKFLFRIRSSLCYQYRERALFGLHYSQDTAHAETRRGIHKLSQPKEAIETVIAATRLAEHGVKLSWEDDENEFIRLERLPSVEAEEKRKRGEGMAFVAHCRNHEVALALLHAFSVPDQIASLSAFKGSRLTLSRTEAFLTSAIMHPVDEKKRKKNPWQNVPRGSIYDTMMRDIRSNTVLTQCYLELDHIFYREEDQCYFSTKRIGFKWTSCTALALLDYHLATPATPPRPTLSTTMSRIAESTIIPAASVWYGGVYHRGNCKISTHMALMKPDTRLDGLLDLMDVEEEEEEEEGKEGKQKETDANPEEEKGKKDARVVTSAPTSNNQSRFLMNLNHGKRMKAESKQIPYMIFASKWKTITKEEDLKRLFGLPLVYPLGVDPYEAIEKMMKSYVEIWVHCGCQGIQSLYDTTGLVVATQFIATRFPEKSVVRNKYQEILQARNYVT